MHHRDPTYYNAMDRTMDRTNVIYIFNEQASCQSIGCDGREQNIRKCHVAVILFAAHMSQA